MFEIKRSTNNNDINEVIENAVSTFVPLAVPEAVTKGVVVGLQDPAPNFPLFQRCYQNPKASGF